MNSPWKTLLREAVAVLAAILVAFALDAWWGDVVEKRDMREALEAVRLEIGANRNAIDAVLAANDIAQRASLRIGLVTDAEIDTMSAEALRELTQAALQQVFTPEQGAVTAFVEGGSLSALRDVELRTAVAGLTGAYAEIDEEKDAMIQSLMGVLDALVRTHPDGRSSTECMAATFSSWNEDRARECMRRHVGNDEIVYRMLTLTTVFEVHHAELRALRSRLEALDAEIGAELGS